MGLDGVVIVPNIFPAQFVEALAVWALGYPAFHCAFDVGLGDGTVPLDGWGADLHRLGVVERGLSGHCQFPRVALSASTRSPAVTFIPQHIADGFRCQSVRLGGAAHGQDAAGVRLLQNGVAAVSALALCHLCPQGRTVSYHGSDTQLAVLLGISLNRVDKKDRSGVNVNRSADDIVFKFALADLRGRYDNDVMDARVRVCVHNFHQIGRSAVAPATLFSRCFRGQDAVLCCPLADRHVGRRANSCHQLRHQSIQAVYCGVVTHPRHRPVFQSTTGVPGREPHTWPGHSGTERFPPQSD